MAYQPKNWRWCKHCQRDTSKNGHTPFCPATTIEAKLRERNEHREKNA